MSVAGAKHYMALADCLGNAAIRLHFDHSFASIALQTPGKKSHFSQAI